MSAPLRLSAEQRRQLREELQRRGLGAGPEIGPRPDRDGDPPLSFSQERLWFLDQLRPGSAMYNIPAAIRLSGPLDPAVLAACFAEIVRRHDTLRTTFPVPAGAEPRQRVVPASPVPLPRVDLAGLPVEIRDRETERLTTAEASAPFHLAAGPLLRVTFLRLEPEEHLLLLTVHHIVADGWSVGLLIHEMRILFEAFASGLPSPLAELPIQYADFTVWQRRHMSGALLESELAFWSERLRDAPAELALPTDRPRPPVPGERGASCRLRLTAGLAAGVHALARSARATPFMVLLAAFEILLSRLSGQTDLTIGTPVAGRHRSEVKSLVGFFVNTLVLRADLADDPSVSTLLACIRRDTLAAYTHQELPFEKLVEHLQPGRLAGRNPLFQVLFALQNHPWPELRLGSLRISSVESGSGTAKADLTLTWQEAGESFEAALEYSTELFEEATAERLLLWTARLLDAAVGDPTARARELPLLAAAERAALLAAGRGVQPPYPRDATIHGLVRERALRTPEAIAVEMGGERWTYAGLAARAHRLAHRLRALGVRTDGRVGLAVERSADLVAGMLGILAAGGAYVPLDLSSPQERLDWMIEDAGIAVIVHSGGWQGSPAVPRVDLGDSALDGESTDAPMTDATADHLAYVIYTSGSTGRPKGVAVPHRAVVRLLVETDYVRLEPADRVAQVSNPAFDAATFEVWGALFAGARLVGVPREEALSPDALARRLSAEGVTALFLTTALLNQVARQAPGAFRGVRHLLFGGEAVDAGAVREVLRYGPPGRLLHVYGPTETTTFATWHEVADLPAQAATVPIGRPLAHAAAHVVSPGFELAPAGMPGELLLGGDGLARGYHRRPDLTAERFVPHPWSDRPGDRLYRTGDLVRRSIASGALEFLGRLDQQVKIRGFRIEPGEIEAVLGSHPEVAECAVVVLGSSSEDRRLAAWITPRQGAAPEPAALRTWLTGRLPAYMVPAAFGLLDNLPLNPNGKVDLRALARLQPQSAAARGAALETPLEQQIAAVWSEVLGHERVGRDDDFFALGGHSLLATRVMSRLRVVFGVDLPLRRLFEVPTVAGLAEAVADALRGGRTSAPPLAPVSRGEELPLSFAQQRLWFLDRLEPGSAVYNIPAAVRMAGSLAPAVLAAALGEVVARHEVLRTTFATGTDCSGEPIQRIAPPSPVPLPLVDLGGLPEARREREAGLLADEEAARPFDLGRGPLLHAALLRLAPAEHVVVFTMHHIVADGWSVGVLVRELAALYEAFAQGRTPLLPLLPVQYADFAVWQREWLSGTILERELAWWRERLAGAPTLLELPTDRPRPRVQTFRGARTRASVPADLTREMGYLCRRSEATLFMALLAAFGALLHRHTAQEDLVVGMPIAGRNRLETENLIGLFVNTLALRVDAAGDPGYGELQRRVRESLLGAYTHQDLPFEKLVTELVTERSLAHAPLVQVLLVLQNAPSATLELPGLTLSGVEIEARTAKLDLVLNLTETEHGLAGMWIYNTDLFDVPTVLRLQEHFRTLLAAAVADPGRRLSELPMLTEGERHQLLVGWNDAAVDLPRDLCAPDLFEAQAARTPDRLAVSDSREETSYGELRDRAGRLASRLLEAGLEPEEPVAVWCERGTGLLAAILGIFRAGGAYLPLDPHHPPQRIRQILEQTGSRLVLVSEPFLQDCRRELEGGPKVLLIADLLTERAAERPCPRVLPGHVAYVLFTSGSTGAPKGVVVEHRGMLNHLQVKIHDLGMGPADRVAQTASQTFDISVWQFLAALLAGGTVHVVPDEVVRDPVRLVTAVREREITVLETVPSLLSAMLDGLDLGSSPRAGLPALRWLMPTGEALPPDLCRQWLAAFPGVPLINAYGPTECSDDVTHGILREPPPAAAVRISIGRPVANTRIHLLGRRFEPVPVGVAGELCIGGPQLARGYWGRPDLTADRFVPSPFSGEPGDRLYRTGDLARWRTEGSLEFLGRIDHQVKVRGFRIELGEIEAVLASHPGIAEAVVLARLETGGPRLVAYVTAWEGERLSLPDLRSFLGERLPEYMLPSGFVPLEEMPRTTNGKLDRRALERLVPEPEAGDGWEEPVAPRTELERFLADLFRQTAGLERVGIHDSFFELGGNSISGAIVINRVQQRLGEIVHVVALFDHPTVAGLADYLTRDYPEAVARVWGPEPLDDLAAAAPAVTGVDAAKVERLQSLLRQGLVRREARLPKNPPAVFVLSPPRSGSTLLRVMLGGHPRLFAPPELELLGFATMAQRRAAFAGRDAFLLEGLIRAVMEARRCGAEEARSVIEEAEREELSTQELYVRLQGWLGGRSLVDKTPSYALDPEALRWAEESFERPLYVHLLRHPAAVVRSFEEARMEQVFFRREHGFSRRELAELTWLISHQNILELLAGVPAERQLQVRFEELVRKPVSVLEGICSFLGLEPHPAMAEPYETAGARMVDGLHAESRMLGDVKFLKHRRIDPDVAERWRRELPLPLGEPTCALAACLGYDVEWPRRQTPGLISLVRSPSGEPVPLSFSQQRLWFLHQLEPDSPAYNMPLAVRLTGSLARAALRDNLTEIVRRHEALRTTFDAVPGGSEPVQRIAPPGPVALPLLDLGGLPPALREAEARRLAAADAARPFDLARGPLLRVALLRLALAEHVALLTMHHIVADGWSIGVLVQELTALYTASVLGTPSPLPELPVQYADYAVWQRAWLQGEVLQEELGWWRAQLAGAPSLLTLPLDHSRPAVAGRRGRTRRVRLPAGPAKTLTRLGRQQGATLFMTLLAVWNVLLLRLSGEGDLVVGTPIANRHDPGIEGLIGFFVNTLVLRNHLTGESSFAHLLARVRESTLEAYAHQDLPFEKLVEEIAPERSLAHAPLFQVMLVLQNAPAGPLDLPRLRLESLPVEPDSTKFDLMLSFTESDDGLHGSLLYATNLFEATTIDRMLAGFARLLEGAAAAPELPVGDLPLLTAAESHQLSVEWNDTRRADPGDVTLHRLFTAQVERSPEAPALTCAGQTLTYRELDRRANRLARRLRGLGVGPEVVVGVLCERSPDMVVAMLAILKAGGAYLPLSPEQPEERLIHLLGEVAAPVLVTEERLAFRLPAYGGARLLVDVDEPREEPEHPLDGGSGTGNLAYVIYTSGSTGWPKGVAIEHRSAVALVTWAAEVFPREELRGVLASTAIYFDLSVFELFVTLSRGGRVFLVDDVLALATLDTGGELTLVNTVPSALAELLRLGALPVSVRTVNLAGEPLQSSLVRQLYGLGSVRRVLNLYGPSEDTTYSTFARVDPDEDVPPIGAPLAGTRLSLLDCRLLPVPIGAVGAICLAGAGLARGYFGQPALTADRFLPDPSSDQPGARIYRTGDLARYRTSGALEYLGRVDHQVKLRGFRIELGEIEAVLQRHPRVRQAVAAVRSDRKDDLRLAVYVVPETWDGGETAAGPALADDLRCYLGNHLPPYMIPSTVTLLESLPLTPTGKVDRKALPEPDRGEHAGASIAPRTPVERALAEIWCEILGQERVGVTESFFALGGHSLLAVRVLFRIRQTFGADLPLRALFEETTIARLASRLESADREGRASAASLVPRPAGSSPLSFAQERLWLLHQLEPHSAAYNLPLAVRLTGSLDPAALAGALLALIARHEPLRTTFRVRAERPVQVVGAPAPLLLPWVDLTGLRPDLRETEARRLIAGEAARPFDLARGPILRALLLGLGSGEYQALLTLHHIAGDGWSLEILLREWAALYRSASSGIPSQLPPLPVRYCDYAAWQRSEASGPIFAEQLSWWARQLAGAPAALDLPMERPRPAVQTSRGAAAERLLSRELCRRIEGMCRDRGATPFMILLTALAALLHRYTGQDDLVVGTLTAGRTRAETEGLIGIFLNTLALRIVLSGDPTARELLDRVRDTVLGAFDHQDVPFERLLEEIRPERDLSRTPLFQIVLNWLGFGAGGERVELPELIVEPLPATLPIAKFDLEVYASLRSEQIHLRAVYNRDLFAPAQIDDLLAHLEALLAGMAAQPDRRLYELPLARIPSEDRCSPVETAVSGLPREALDPSIPERFAVQVAAHAGRPAVVARGEIWTYAELAREVDRVAHALLALRGIREERVALLFSPGAPMVAAVLGTLAAGRTYVPLDSSYPRERLLDMVADSQAKVLLAGDDQRRLAGELAAALPVLLFGEPPPAPSQWTPPPVPPEALAYLLYTSGSTGQPKGVMQSHGNVLGHIRSYGERLDIVPGDRVTLLASYSFDAAVMDIFGALLHGAALCLWDLKTESMDGFAAWLAKHEITLYHSTPTVYRHVFSSLRDGAGCPSLRAVVLGGEEARSSDLELFLRTSPPGCRLINGLGPTESTLALQHALDQATEVRRPSLPIGRPVPETEVLVRTPAGMQPAVWGIGEIQICSPYLAPGYWRRPNLTAERFVPDPFGKVPGRRLYRTGDLARRLPGGELEFLGRIDDQVKIRGVRIEPAEVEVALASHPRVREAVVVVRENAGERRMVAYVAAPGGPAPEPEGLRLFLRERLPEPMIPATFVVLEALPLTPTGKVDRRSLPVPEEPAGAASAAPATPVEEILCGLWAELLGLEAIGREDDFFDLGGHSLKATQLVSRIRASFGVEIPLRVLFEASTVAALARHVEAARAGGAEAVMPPLVAATRSERLPLSFAQERLWVLDQLEPGNSSLNMPAAVVLRGTLDVRALERSLEEVVRRHESLRTTFVAIEGRPYQRIHPAASLRLPAIDLEGLPPALRPAELRRLETAQARHAFDLAAGPLLTIRLVRTAPGEHVLLLNLHHIVSDGWSRRLLVQEVGELYGAFSQGRPSPLAGLPVQYADFAAWQRRWLQGEVLASQLAYWRKHLGGEAPALDLPLDRPRPRVQTFRGASLRRALPQDLSGALHNLSRRRGATPFMTLLAAFAVLLSRQSGQEDLLVGTPIAGRVRAELEGLIGCFLNTLVLRLDLSGPPGFADLVSRVRDVCLEAYAHQHIPFEKLLEELRPTRDLSRTPWFQVYFNMLNLPGGELRLPDIEAELAIPPEVPAKFDLTLYAAEAGGQFALHLVYNADLFDAPRMEDILAQLETLLDQALERPEEPVGQHPLVTAAARAILPDPAVGLSANWEGSVHEIFARHALRSPEALAVVDPVESWTYGDLDGRANRLAAFLQAGGVRPGDVVAFWAHRSAPLVWGVLGALKAGAAFLMLDPRYPAPRQAQMLEIARPAAWLRVAAAGPVPAEIESALGCACRLVLPSRAEETGFLTEAPAVPPAVEVGLDDVAYVAFTSGSTGVPKGVLGRQGSLSHFIPWLRQRFELSSADRFSMLSGLAHDPLHRDLFTPLQIGAAIVIPDPETMDEPGRLAAWMRETGVTIAHLTPALGQVLTTEAPGSERIEVPSLRYTFLVGDVLTRRDVTRLRRLAPAVTCVNYYGSTETQRAVGYHVAGEDEPREVLPLGSGIPDVQLLVLNPAGALAGVGELGEVSVRSPHIALGYLRDPQLTAQRFVADLYRTGDLGRYLPNGEAVFAGRADTQVKIRGFRIELGEIEAVLGSFPGIREAVVIARQALQDTGEERYLAAYMVPAAGASLVMPELRAFLRERLPDSMVPATFTLLDELPLTPNRKVDRRALERIELPGTGERGAAAPRTQVEEILVGLWAEVLGVGPPGIEDSFFDLGGHSLLVTRLLSRVRTAFGVDLPFRSLFEHPTIGGLARLIDEARLQARGLRIPPLVPWPDEQEAPLSYSQQRLWFMSQLEPESAFYNVPTLVEVCGELDIRCVSRALTEIVRRHGSLRTLFAGRDRQPVQIVQPARPLSVPVIDLSALPGPGRERESRKLASEDGHRTFDLSRKPAWRCQLLKLGEQRHVMVLVLHHIITDGWSNRLLVRELLQLYQSFAEGRPSPLAELPVQYTDFARWQRQWLQGEILEAQLAYWRDKLAGAPAAIGLPLDHPRPAAQSFRGSRQSFEIPAEMCLRLERLARREGCTLFMLLLSSFNVFLHHVSGDEDIVVGAPFNYRNWTEIEGLVGFFVNTLLFRSDLSGNPTFRELLARARRETLEAFAHEHVPFQKLVEEVRPERALALNPLFQVGFTFQTAANEDLPVSGLTLRYFPREIETTQLDLNLSVRRTDQGLLGELQYSRDLFRESTISGMVEQLRLLLERVSEGSDLRLSEVRALLAEADKRRWGVVRRELVQKKRQSFQSRKRQAVIVGPEDQP